MSRTKHHGDRQKQRTYGYDWMHWGWLGNEPRWWRKMMELSKYRRTERELLTAAKRSEGDPADGHWPDFKRPGNCYW